MKGRSSDAYFTHFSTPFYGADMSLQRPHIVLIAVISVAAFCLSFAGAMFLLKSWYPKDRRPAESQDEKRVTVAPEQPTLVKAEDLLATYKTNSIAADQKYRGKVIGVGGQIHSFGRSGNDPYILIAGIPAEPGRYVRCKFRKGQENRLVNLKKDGLIVAIGTCKGQAIYVDLVDCWLGMDNDTVYDGP